MSASEKVETPDRNFTRKSDTESICLSCSATVKCATPEFLEIKEQIHSKFLSRTALETSNAPLGPARLGRFLSIRHFCATLVHAFRKHSTTAR